MILFLDACAVIYLVESEAAFHARVVATLRDLRRRFPEARLAVSRLSLLECLVKPMRDGDAELIAEYRAFFAAGDLLVVELDARVIDLALTLRAGDGLRTPDALQAASALTLPAAGHRFLTNDRRFARVSALSVVDLGAARRRHPIPKPVPNAPWRYGLRPRRAAGASGAGRRRQRRAGRGSMGPGPASGQPSSGDSLLIPVASGFSVFSFEFLVYKSVFY